MKKIAINEEFSLEGTIYLFAKNEDKICLKMVGKTKSKPTFTPPPLADVIEYFKVNGYTEQAAKTAYNYYSVANWRDANNKPVANWKQKMIAVWFKDINKIIQQTSPAIKFFQ